MEPFIGEIKMFAGNFAPKGWFLCDGSLLPISQYSAFFSLIGTVYGGDGMSTFAVPDLRGRAPIHQGQGRGGLSNYNLGDMGGTENVTLTQLQMPAHTHMVNTVNKVAKQYEPTGGILAASGFFTDGTEVCSYSADPADGTLSPAALTAAGGNQPVRVQSPYLAVNFIIAWQGVWPSRP